MHTYVLVGRLDFIRWTVHKLVFFTTILLHLISLPQVGMYNRISSHEFLMRKVDRKMLDAIESGRNFSGGNRLVKHNDDGITQVYFHGHRIAEIDKGQAIWINNCGYWTVTTKQILNEICLRFANSWLYQRKFDWFVESRTSKQVTEYVDGWFKLPWEEYYSDAYYA